MRTKRRGVLLAGLTALIMATATLSTAFGQAQAADTQTVYNLKLDHSMISLKPGQGLLLTLKSDVPAETMKWNGYWVSSDPKVATVDNTGRVLARNTGNCVVTAGVGALQISCRVEVGLDPRPVDGPEKDSEKVGVLFPESTDFSSPVQEITSKNEIGSIPTGFASLMPENWEEAAWGYIDYGTPAVVYQSDITYAQITTSLQRALKKTNTASLLTINEGGMYFNVSSLPNGDVLAITVFEDSSSMGMMVVLPQATWEAASKALVDEFAKGGYDFSDSLF